MTGKRNRAALRHGATSFSNLAAGQSAFFSPLSLSAERGRKHDVCPPCNSSSHSEGHKHLQPHFLKATFKTAPIFRSEEIFQGSCINNHVITHLPTLAPDAVSLAGLVFLPFYLSVWEPHIYTLEEWHGIVNSITAPEGVSAQGAPRESHTERLSPKPPRSTANSSVISDQTGPRTDQPCTHPGRWGQWQNPAASSPASVPYIHTNIHTRC